mgnify:CR=1 FL=1
MNHELYTTFQYSSIKECLVTFRQYETQLLVNLLQNLDKNICLFLDEELNYDLNQIMMGSKIFKKNQVTIWNSLNSHIEIKQNQLLSKIKSFLFIVKPTTENMENIVLHYYKYSKPQYKFVVCFIPHSTPQCKQILIDKGVYGKLIIKECPIYLFPIDGDLLSMEIDHHSHSLSFVAKALVDFHGFTANTKIHVKGPNSKIIQSMIHSLMSPETSAKNESNQIDTLILFDRSNDWIPLLTLPITYEALIYEMFDVKGGIFYIDTKAIYLNDHDDVFRNLRNLHYEDAKTVWHQMLKMTVIEKPHEESPINLVQDFVQNIKSFQTKKKQLGIHLKILEFIVEHHLGINSQFFIDQWKMERAILNESVKLNDIIDEHLVDDSYPINSILRLLCLYSVVNNGLSKKEYQLVLSKLYEFYSTQHNDIDQLIQKLNKLKILTTKNNNLIHSLKQSFSFAKEEIGELFSKKKSTSTIIDKLNSVQNIIKDFIPFSCHDIVKIISNVTNNFSELTSGQTSGQTFGQTSEENKIENIIVFFVGGVTFTEITVLRLFSKLCPNINLTIMTTRLVNSKSLF